MTYHRRYVADNCDYAPYDALYKILNFVNAKDDRLTNLLKNQDRQSTGTPVVFQTHEHDYNQSQVCGEADPDGRSLDVYVEISATDLFNGIPMYARILAVWPRVSRVSREIA